jgi:hypothetical protein
LPHVVDVELRACGVRIERDPERVAQPPREGFLALRAHGCHAGRVAPRGAGSGERIARRDASAGRDAQDLAEQDVLIARRVVLAAASAVEQVVATAVADADVEVPVFAELEVSRVVDAVLVRNVVDQDRLGRRVDHVGVRSTNRDTRFTGTPVVS